MTVTMFCLVDSQQRNVAIQNAMQMTNELHNIQSISNNFVISPHFVTQRRTYAKVIAPG